MHSVKTIPEPKTCDKVKGKGGSKMNMHQQAGNQSNRIVRVLLGLMLSLLVVALLGCSSQQGSSASQGHRSKTTSGNASASVHSNGHWATVTHVADGDTITLDGGEKVRLIGVNTPETVKPNSPVQPYGKEASDYTKAQLQGKKVFIEMDVQPTDRYGRTLAYVFLKEPKTDADVEAYMYNAVLVREGYAQLMTIPPNVKYTDLFVRLQHQAHEQNKGLWALGIYKDAAKSTNDVFLPGKAPKK
jgi:micrococcal nuclease